MFTKIPEHKPDTPLLDQVNEPQDLRQLEISQLAQFCSELREYLLFSVGQSGGHFGAGLGVIELTTALHYVFNTPDDKLVWDVGHQAYPHKILTGRKEQMPTIRSKEGPAAFPLRSESEYDTFGVGHSSTSIGAALGMSIAMKAQGLENEAIAIIGDGAMTAGMAFEALNHAGHDKSDMLVILNDNDMAISDNTGALNTHFTRLWSSQTYSAIRESGKKVLENMPSAWDFVRKTEEHMKAMVAPGIIFEELGWKYYGPIDGHDVNELVKTLENLSKIKGPRFLHVVTKKGKGFEPAEQDQIKYHALKPSSNATDTPAAKKPTYSNIFGRWLCDTADQDERLIAITPAMKEGSDLIEFADRFPQRYIDVAIAEQHAVTLAGGLACEGAKPVVAIYSTFLQRAYDQLIHDVALQNLDVLFAIDRAGLVGEDGPTHHGAYDLSYMRCIPNIVVMTPSDEQECRLMLTTGYQHQGPAAVRYPRGAGIGIEPSSELETIPVGKSKIVRESSDANNSIAILSFGAPLKSAQQVAEKLNATLVDMRFVKPLDVDVVKQVAASHKAIVTVEENAVMGGAGSAVLECLAENNLMIPCKLMGIPDRYIEHASPAQQWQEIDLAAEGMLTEIQQWLK